MASDYPASQKWCALDHVVRRRLVQLDVSAGHGQALEHAGRLELDLTRLVIVHALTVAPLGL